MQGFFKIYAEKLSIFLLFLFFLYNIFAMYAVGYKFNVRNFARNFLDFVLRIIPSCPGISFWRNSVWKKFEDSISSKDKCIRKINVR